MTSLIDRGAGPALICLHGVGGDRNFWARQEEAVLAAGWRFIALDAPGIGETPPAEAPGFGPHVAAVIGAMDRLEIDRAAIMGHSMGGMTAQEVYAAHPERVGALILSATSPAFGKGPAQEEFLRQRIEPFEKGLTMAEFAAQSAPGLLGPNPRAGLAEEVAAAIAGTPAEAYVMGWRTIAEFERRALLPEIAVPTLLIAGAHDRNSPAPMMEKMASKIPGAEYRMIEGVGHMAPMEAPDAFNAILTGFLKRIAP